MSIQVAQAWYEYICRSPDFISLIRDEGEILWANRGLPGKTKDDIIGKNIFGLFEQQHWETLRHCIMNAQNDGKTYIFESSLVRPSEEKLWYQHRIMCLFSSKEAHPLISWTSIDISEEKAAERQTKDISQRLQFSNERLSNFAKLISHDLRVPLRLIYSYLDLLGNTGQLLDMQWEMLRKSQDATILMDKMILSLLDYSKFDEQGLEERFPLEVLVEEVLREIREEHKTFTYKVFRLPRSITAQRDRIARVYRELILNSIIHAGENVHVDIFSIEERHYWHLCVGDNGKGILKEKRAAMLHPFSGLREEDKSNGLGMGLSICDKIIQGHGGHFWLDEREHDSGLLVHIAIPKKINVDDIQNDFTVEVSRTYTGGNDG